jgi:DNA repair photolyase
MEHDGTARIKGRGSASNRVGRFEATRHERERDDWFQDPEDEPGRPRTTVTEETARSIIARNDSPDIPFAQSINPYRGCEHGCIYCYARPSHGYLNLSAGLDFETKLFAKTNAVERLRAELARPAYTVQPITLGANTDPYQPIEKRYRLTRELLRVFVETRHPCTIITKSAMVERDIDLLADLARDRLAHVFVSITSLDNRLSSVMEPRASAPHRRVAAIKALTAAGIPASVLVAPVIPMVTDEELEKILGAAHEAGAVSAGYVLVRLPYEIKELFREWLALHRPERAQHVMSLIQQMRGGRDNDPNFGTRMRGTGVFAQLLKRRFEIAREKLGFAARDAQTLDTTRFRPPRTPSPQGELFGD